MKKLLFPFLFFCLCACSIDDTMSVRSFNAEFETDSLHEGMIFVKAEKAFVVVGSDKERYSRSERPSMTVRFDYNFSMDRHEVLYGDMLPFADSLWGAFAKLGQTNIPVTGVTYFDAVLFANAKSKAHGLDTAYTFNQINLDEDGHCTNMEGLTYHPEVNSYRLPTEAEWMLAASKNWNLDNAWLMENSQGQIHPACSIGENLVGFCDLAGNVMEWVNDWKGLFKDTVVFNYGGAPDGGLSGERVLKGGSFRTARKSTNLVSRGDVYTVTSSTQADYVGFRLAFGRIPDVTWMNDNSSSFNSRLISQVQASTLRSKLGTIQTKLAFRNDFNGHIAFFDYSISANSVLEINDDTLDCYHPDISPNGALVAFSTGTEGVSMESSVYVRFLNLAGDSLVKLNVKNASIPRWIVRGTDTSIVYVTSAGNNKNESDFMSQSTWEVPFKNFKFGIPRKLFDGAYHGGISYDDRLAVTGARLLRVRLADSAGTLTDANAHDTVWYNGEQACNVSLAPDSTKRTLFLDFASKIGQEFVGTKYQVHERLLIADSLGKLIQSVAAPKGYSFDHSEWITGGQYDGVLYKSNFVVATLANLNGGHDKIVMVDLRDSSITDLVAGTEMWHPCLWSYAPAIPVGPLYENLDLDSAVLYYESEEDPLITLKMNAFWNKRHYLKVVGLGSSRMSLGFNSNKISFGSTLNMAAIPSDMDVNYYLAKNYVLKHCPKLKYIVLGLDLDLWSDEVGVNIRKNIKNISGFHYDAHHDFWNDSVYAAFSKLSYLYLRQRVGLHRMSLRMGWVEEKSKNSWTKGGFGNDFLTQDSTWSNRSSTYKTAMEELQQIIELSGKKNVIVLGVIFPQSPDYAKTGSFGRHGMRRTHAIKILDSLKKMEQDYPNFFLMDENKMGNHDYPDSVAFDYDHMNSYGADILTSKIDSAITFIEGK